MKRIALVAAVSMALAFSLFAPALAQTPTPPQTPVPTGNGAIKGTVADKTAGAALIGAGTQVTLVVLANGQMISSETTTTDASGNYSFSSLATDASYSYETLVTYKGIHYTSDSITFSSGQTSQTGDVNVYETTDSNANVSVMLAHFVFSQGNGTLSVLEYYLVTNTGDRTYVGSSAATTPDGSDVTMSFSLPQNATNVQYAGGLTDLTTYSSDHGLVTSTPIIPGMNGLGYSYDLPNTSDKFTFTTKMMQDASRLDISVQGGKATISGKGLTVDPQPLNVQGTLFSHASEDNLKAGDVVTFQLSGLTGDQSPSLALWVVIALAVLVVLGAGGYLVRRNRAQPQPAPVGPPPGLDEGEKLMAELAALDDDFESGKIPEEEYKKLRAAKKAEILERLQKAEGKGGE